MVARVLSKNAQKVAKIIRKNEPSISNTELNKKLNTIMKEAGESAPAAKAKKMRKIPMDEVQKRLDARKKVDRNTQPGAGASKSKKTKPNADAAGKAFLKDKPPAGSGDQGKGRKLPRGNKKTGKLQQEFEALTPKAQRAEIAKGANSKYARVLRKLGKLKESKMGGGKVMNKKVTYRKEGKQIGSDPKTGATRGTGMEGFTSGKQLKDVPADKKGLSKLPTKVRNKMGFKKGGGQVMKYRKGGMVYMKNGGVVKASNDGDKLVAACYDNGKKSKA